jgi:hypothetical protein
VIYYLKFKFKIEYINEVIIGTLTNSQYDTAAIQYDTDTRKFRNF